MRTRLCWVWVVLLSAIPLFSQTGSDPGVFRVQEHRIRLSFQPQLRLEMPVKSTAARSFKAHIHIEFLEQNNEIAEVADQDTSILPGSRTLLIPLAFKSTFDSPADLYWWRLKYRISAPVAGAFPAKTGIVQAGRIITTALSLEAAAMQHGERGSNLPVRVRLEDVIAHRAVAGARVEARFQQDDDDDSKSAPASSARTDAQGYALLNVKIPSEANTDSELELTAKRGPWKVSQSLRLDLRDRVSLTLSTDKPIYQPGQTLHMRLLAMGENNHAAASQEVTFSIEDEEGDPQFKQQAVTSHFGIARADWEIPAKLRSGHYRVRVELTKNEAQTASEVRITQYELPEFTVSPATDKPYYLPGQQPHIEVVASYLFGKPVSKGTVRIVRDYGSHWNSETRSYEINQEDLQQGALDAAGKFSSTLNLKDDFERLADSDYQRYEDLRFAAYVTDTSTNRTEQKHFTVRISKELIHLYVINPYWNTAESPDIYITAAFPDGTPAAVNVVLSAVKPTEDGTFPEEHAQSDLLRLARVHTNRYGIARIHINPLSREFIAESSYSADARLLLEADDGHGGHGEHNERIGLYSEDYLRLKPLKRVLAAGEAVVANIESSLPDQTVFAELLSQNTILTSVRLQLHHGHAQVEFPYSPEFRGNLSIVAYNMRARSGQDKDKETNLVGGAEVLFPEPQGLDLGLTLEHTTYKPGEAASAEFHVRDAKGRAAQSALGVVIYDKAVAERVRSDQEFGTYGFSFFNYDWERYPDLAGIHYSDLLNRKLSGPVDPDWELLAEAMLVAGQSRAGEMGLALDETFASHPGDVFHDIIGRSLEKIDEILRANYATTGTYPATEDQFRSLLAEHGYSFELAHDAWDMPYHVRFTTADRNAVLKIVSNGPDKAPDTSDNFTARQYTWPFFTPTGRIMDAAMLEYAQLEGKYIRDLDTLRAQMALRGVDLDSLRDPWGHPYSFTFDISGPRYQINVSCQEPVRSRQAKQRLAPLAVWQSSIHYFLRETKQIDDALARGFLKSGHFPSSEPELIPLLQSAGLDALVDPWGNPYHFEFEQTSRYANHVDIKVYSSGDAGKLVPVTQSFAWIHVVSYGPNNNRAQKFSVAEFNQLLTEQSSNDLAPLKVLQAPMNGSSGAVTGIVTDPAGAVIAGATVIATNDLTGAQYTVTSDQNGLYLLVNLPAGKYSLRIERPGFRTTLVNSVPVMSSNITKVDAALSVGGVSETVEVTSAAPMVETATTSVSQTVRDVGVARVHIEQQVFTPRLRKYFPETLLWQPELITDSSGKAQLKFAMADNITTWKISVIGSTANGQLGLAEKELRTFQPFFIDHEPPKILTQGDQIELPVVLRNYLNKPQEVNVKLDSSAWFKPLGALQERVSVPPGQDATARFLISAEHSIREGKEHITAANHETGDAIERTLIVHPDGEELSQVVARLLYAEQNSVALEIPQNAIPGSIDAELKIYPNFGAHVLDSLKGMVERPAGCGEQVTSIAFASLMVLQVLHKAGQDDPRRPDNPNAELASRARKYVNDAYQQLLTFQNSNGGIPFWLHEPPSLPLTAYVLDFLVQASQFIEVNPDFVKRARNFLVSSQQQDGAWLWQPYYGSPRPDLNVTAQIVRSLAAVAKAYPGDAASDRAMSKAMDYLRPQINQRTDAYLLGQYALAAAYTGRQQDVELSRKTLAGMMHEEGSAVYWNLEANMSPFFGWGFPGRLETTGIVLQALAELAQTSHDPRDLELINRGLLFLVSHKDRYGIWYSTHASVQVLRAIVAALPQFTSTGKGGVAQILVNGKPAGEVHLPAVDEVAGPAFMDISGLLTQGSNKVEIVRRQDGSPLQAQIISGYYTPWPASRANTVSGFKPGDTRSLRLNVAFDRTDAQAGQSIRCHVEVERIGFEGYGMMLAEIGLPPGAEVDRESLERAKASYAISQYEVLPDRLVVYVWPKAGGSKFSFDFKPRFAMNAANASSILYDYYNPEARATVSPTRFHVQ